MILLPQRAVPQDPQNAVLLLRWWCRRRLARERIARRARRRGYAGQILLVDEIRRRLLEKRCIDDLAHFAVDELRVRWTLTCTAS